MPRLCRPIIERATVAVVLCFGTCSIGRAQTHDIDSLRTEVGSGSQDLKVKASTLYKLSREYWDHDLDSAFAVADELLAFSQRSNYSTGIGHAYSSMGVVRWYQGNYPDAQHYNELALKAHLSSDPPRSTDIAGSYHNLGLVHDDQGNYPEALKYYLEAMKVYADAGFSDGVAQERSAIAVIHFNQKDLPAALAENQKALAIREASQDEWGLTETYSNLGITYVAMGNYDSALVWYDKALALRTRIDDQQGLAVSYNNYGDLYTLQGRYADALESFERALAINERLGYKKSMADVRLNMGKLFDKQGDPRRALHQKELALGLAEEVGATDYEHMALEELSNTWAQLGDHAKAYAYRLRFEALSDTIFNDEKTRSLVRQQMNYGFAQRQLADSLAAEEAKHLAERDHEIELSAERNRRNLFALGGVTILVVSLALWSRLRYVRRTRDTILRTQQQLVASEKQREAEQVRTRIARDVHDEIGSELTKITLLIAQTKRDQARTTATPLPHLDGIAALSRQVSASLNDIVWAVDPRHDSVQALVVHAQHYTERMLENSTARIEQHFVHTGTDRPLDPATKRNIFLLLKEALNNALKYAKAERISVSLTTDEHGFALCVADNGVGFDAEALARKGNGLRNMEARCAALGATLVITATPGAGCTVQAHGPIP
ncbi:MAG: tetratricopeptide repeat protein [Flavobacteriales bacterium]|nr:tetratricopeptide repeat protein [Flavobacteriales bacterium]MBK9539091.1 tetratricopeptide repeat protein [Flavobacteriales bacterium]